MIISNIKRLLIKISKKNRDLHFTLCEKDDAFLIKNLVCEKDVRSLKSEIKLDKVLDYTKLWYLIGGTLGEMSVGLKSSLAKENSIIILFEACTFAKYSLYN